MKKLFIAALLLGVSLAACSTRTPAKLGADAPADKVPNIIGEYAVNGFDPLGEEYGGRLTITAGEKPNEYKMQWLVTGGVHEGVGILNGNQLTVAWKSLSGPIENVSGAGLYTVTVNGELYGTRSIDGTENPGTETVYPNPK
ncbi:MAG: hypothetical protein PHQ36_13250 [Anaerolineales bacterium]|nr:hypothetical protein [Anaerolineales bacterium]